MARGFNERKLLGEIFNYLPIPEQNLNVNLITPEQYAILLDKNIIKDFKLLNANSSNQKVFGLEYEHLIYGTKSNIGYTYISLVIANEKTLIAISKILCFSYKKFFFHSRSERQNFSSSIPNYFSSSLYFKKNRYESLKILKKEFIYPKYKELRKSLKRDLKSLKDCSKSDIISYLNFDLYEKIEFYLFDYFENKEIFVQDSLFNNISIYCELEDKTMLATNLSFNHGGKRIDFSNRELSIIIDKENMELLRLNYNDFFRYLTKEDLLNLVKTLFVNFERLLFSKFNDFNKALYDSEKDRFLILKEGNLQKSPYKTVNGQKCVFNIKLGNYSIPDFQTEDLNEESFISRVENTLNLFIEDYYLNEHSYAFIKTNIVKPFLALTYNFATQKNNVDYKLIERLEYDEIFFKEFNSKIIKTAFSQKELAEKNLAVLNEKLQTIFICARNCDSLRYVDGDSIDKNANIFLSGENTKFFKEEIEKSLLSSSMGDYIERVNFLDSYGTLMKSFIEIKLKEKKIVSRIKMTRKGKRVIIHLNEELIEKFRLYSFDKVYIPVTHLTSSYTSSASSLGSIYLNSTTHPNSNPSSGNASICFGTLKPNFTFEDFMIMFEEINFHSAYQDFETYFKKVISNFFKTQEQFFNYLESNNLIEGE